MCVVLVCHAARTARRNVDWFDDASAFGSAAATYPSSAKAAYQLADAAVTRGDESRAIPLLRRALQIYPGYHYAYLHLSRLALRADDADGALAHARASLDAVPAPNAHAHLLAAEALLRLGRGALRAEEAEAHARAAIAGAAAGAAAGGAGTGDGAAAAGGLNALGDALRRQRRWAEAAHSLRGVVELRPREPLPRVNLGAALLERGRRIDASKQFARALELAPIGGEVAERARAGLAAAAEPRQMHRKIVRVDG